MRGVTARGALPAKEASGDPGIFFHLLDTVKQVKGCCRLEDNKEEYTVYSSCMDTARGIYYYTTWGSRRIRAVNMHHENLEHPSLYRFPLIRDEDIHHQN